MLDLIYQQWYFHRPQLAQHYLSMLVEGPGDPIALAGERRIGKTSFLLSDLMPATVQRDFIPVYIDVWQHRSDTLAAINYALQETIDDLEVPGSRIARRLRTSVKKVGLGGASLELGEEPTRKRPESPFLLVDWLLKTLLREARRPVLLIFDEVQELAAAQGGENIISAIRSAIVKSRGGVRVVFTGSSQDKLLELFSRSRAALYEGASTIAFPYLGDDFLRFIAQRVKERYTRQLAQSTASAGAS
jgi:hypothetical protein